jgi:hypothetical protein
MNKNIIIWVIVVVIVVGGISFYSGMKYQSSKSMSAMSGMSGMAGRTGGTFAGRTGIRGAAGAAGSNGVTGQVLSKDATSITVKLQSGGSKIVFLSASTSISTFQQGTIDDVNQGSNVTVVGTTNSDGSVTARSIQIRPSVPAQQ